MAETDLSDWLLAMEAAMRIGCSTRTIERLAAAKKLEARLRPTAGSPPVAVYNPEDVARIAVERQPAPPPFVLGAVPAGNGNGHRPGVPTGNEQLPSRNGLLRGSADPIRQLAALVLHTLQSPPSPPVAETVAETRYVTLKEAAAILGVTEACARRAIKAKRLATLRDWNGLHVRRTDLEAL